MRMTLGTECTMKFSIKIAKIKDGIRDAGYATKCETCIMNPYRQEEDE